MLGDITISCCHITSHDARDGLLAEVIVEESIDFLGSIGSIGIDRSLCNIELYPARITTGDADVIDAEPSPVRRNLDGVFSFVHDERAHFGFFDNLVASLEIACCTINSYIDHLGAIESIVTDIDGILTTFSCCVSKGDFGIVLSEFEGLAT